MYHPRLPAKLTKIVGTIGPASESPEMLSRLMERGLDICRLNFAHGDFQAHARTVAAIRETSAKLGKRVAILADLAGPKIRIGEVADEPVHLEQDALFTLTTQPMLGNVQKVSVAFERLPEVVSPGDTIYLYDGFIQLEVERVVAPDVHCRVRIGGELRSHKGVNLPGIDLGIAAFTPRDRECLEFALQVGVDAVSQSFVQNAADIEAVRQAAREMGHDDIFVIAKVERSLAIANYDGILQAADGIMVARGDLGVEIPIERIGMVQKELIDKANRAGKPVITATQMLVSMVKNSRPTRAEVTDVTNAILDGTDAVMLSEESAMGSYPAEAVGVMRNIALQAEAHRPMAPEKQSFEGESLVEDLIVHSVRNTVARLKPTAVFCPSTSGATPRHMAKNRLPVWVVGMSRNERVCQRLIFSGGVFPWHVEHRGCTWAEYIINWHHEAGLKGKLAVFTQGVSRKLGTNRMEIIDLEEMVGSCVLTEPEAKEGPQRA